jgi:hypothetical protein
MARTKKAVKKSTKNVTKTRERLARDTTVSIRNRVISVLKNLKQTSGKLTSFHIQQILDAMHEDPAYGFVNKKYLSAALNALYRDGAVKMASRALWKLENENYTCVTPQTGRRILAVLPIADYEMLAAKAGSRKVSAYIAELLSNIARSAS